MLRKLSVMLSLIVASTSAHDFGSQVEDNERCAACDWRDDLCGWTVRTSEPDGNVAWHRVVNSHVTSHEHNFQQNPVMDSSNRQQSLGRNFDNQFYVSSCVVIQEKIQPKLYTGRSSYLQIFDDPISCDGEVIGWQFVTVPSTIRGRKFYASVWEKVPSKIISFKLVGWNLLPASRNHSTWEQISVENMDRIAVKRGQYIGIHYENEEMTGESTVVPIAESLEVESKMMMAYASGISHSGIMAKSGLIEDFQLPPTLRLPAIQAVVRAIRTKNEYEVFGDYFLTAEALPGFQLKGSAILESPEIDFDSQIYCLILKYFIKSSPIRNSSTLEAYLDNGLNKSRPLLSLNEDTIGISDSPWKMAYFTLTGRQGKYKVVLEGKPSWIGGAVGISQVEISPHECVYTRETDILVPVSTFENGDDFPRVQLWENGIINYMFDAVFNYQERKIIEDAMELFSNSTCLNFRRIRKMPILPFISIQPVRYIKFMRPLCGRTTDKICKTYVGMQPNGNHQVQPVYLSKRCFFSPGDILHTLAHVVGLWHETNLMNRDDHITVDIENIAWPYKKAFEAYSSYPSLVYEQHYFDMNSITHLSGQEYSLNQYIPTVMAKNNLRDYMLGQRFMLSLGDIYKINEMYSMYARCTGYVRNYQGTTREPRTTTRPERTRITVWPATTLSTTTTYPWDRNIFDYATTALNYPGFDNFT